MLEWMTVWAGVQGVATVATAGIAWYQIGALRRDQKAWKTLEACERYESDLVVTSALKSLRDAKKLGSLETSPQDFRLEVVLVMNYFEGIAIAAAQGFYVEHVINWWRLPIKSALSSFAAVPGWATSPFQPFAPLSSILTDNRRPGRLKLLGPFKNCRHPWAPCCISSQCQIDPNLAIVVPTLVRKSLLTLAAPSIAPVTL